MQQPNARMNFRPANPNPIQSQAPSVPQIQTPAQLNNQMDLMNVRSKAQQPIATANTSIATKRKLADTMYANQQTNNLNSMQQQQQQQGMYQNMGQQPRTMPQASKFFYF